MYVAWHAIQSLFMNSALMNFSYSKRPLSAQPTSFNMRRISSSVSGLPQSIKSLRSSLAGM